MPQYAYFSMFLYLTCCYKMYIIRTVQLLFSLQKLCTDLDQLNRILEVLGSPSQEDLQCIMNEKVQYYGLVCMCFLRYDFIFVTVLQCLFKYS